MMKLNSRLLWALTICDLTSRCAGAYTLAQDYNQTTFFSSFNFFTDTDPTEGFVDYKSYSEAAESNLLGYGPTSVFIFADHINNISTSSGSRGRPSVRLESKQSYDHGLLMVDLTHMPGSICGVWPALWLLGPNWPNGGEIDFLEGVNMQQDNAMTLHTSSGCSVSNSSIDNPFIGEMTTGNCDVNAPHQAQNVGCSIAAPPTFGAAGAETCVHDKASYGSAFNAAGGGIYAVEWTADDISIWFWSRALHPTFLYIARSLATNTPDPALFGTPMARFAGPNCDFESHFKDLRIVLDTTFCGAWAGAVWESEGCAASTGVSTCEEYVGSNPERFREAYWEVLGLKVFQHQPQQEEKKMKMKAKRSIIDNIVNAGIRLGIGNGTGKGYPRPWKRSSASFRIPTRIQNVDGDGELAGGHPYMMAPQSNAAAGSAKRVSFSKLEVLGMLICVALVYILLAD